MQAAVYREGPASNAWCPDDALWLYERLLYTHGVSIGTLARQMDVGAGSRPAHRQIAVGRLLAAQAPTPGRVGLTVIGSQSAPCSPRGSSSERRIASHLIRLASLVRQCVGDSRRPDAEARSL